MKALEIIENKVKEIGRGYTCNFNRQMNGKTFNFINGANTICFTIEGDKIQCHTVGNSRFVYPSPFTAEEFVNELPKMLLTNEECNEAYEKIARAIGADKQPKIFNL